MGTIHIEISEIIPAPASQVYSVLADYVEGHPAILPQKYFRSMSIEEGGQGAGTVVMVRMKVMGVESAYRMTISEPEPGRALVETDDTAGGTTTFAVDPLSGGTHSRLTISSDVKASRGLKGLLEKLLNPPITRRIYRAELQQLAEYMATRSKVAQ